MKTYELGTLIIVALAGAQLLQLGVQALTPKPAPQCMVQATTPEGATVQRWRSCTPAELAATN